MTYAGDTQWERTAAGATSFTNTILGVSRIGTVNYVRDNRGALLSRRDGTTSHYYLLDGLGSVIGLTDSAGGLVSGFRYEYDPFGKSLNEPPTGYPANPWRYVGAHNYHYDPTKLYKVGLRYYDPNVGR